MSKVLIVDDERALTTLLKTLLEMDGFEVAVAPRGMQALDKAYDNPPDVFLIDFNLHDMEGTELVSQLRGEARFANTPIVMASGLDVEDKAMAAGCDHFLIKPFEPSDLTILFNDLISRAGG